MVQSKEKKIFYPSYLERWNKGKPRRYPPIEQIKEKYNKLGLGGKFNRDDLQKHHIDWDRSNNNVDNIAMLTPSEHEQVHSQLIQYISKLVKLGTLEFDHKKPHYYVTDEPLKAKMQELRDKEKQEQEPHNTGLTPMDLYALQNKYSRVTVN